ncbi:Protein ecm33 [Zancudomyces culisetae]|uniref:Protein ecm33 n=1 Tax=Zancudomyces culisetae TaxID=1213189 RepID=A0A1R1PMP2_ZANCU|nr:Protein ecm33 [Zancudomyces culisetae]|eukprot:OMH82142.1 Protein ecm33 [Zancudomyces culisetae]
MIALDLDPLNSANFIRVSQTALAGLTNLNFKRLKSIDISNNIYLQSIEFPRLTWVSGYVSIMNNHIESSLSSPKLTKIDGKLSLSGVSKLDVPALNIINGAINIMEDGFKEFSFEGLETASSDLYIIRNAKLAKFAFPKLNKIGGALLIQNNTLLKDIDNNFFPQLTEMSGKMLFTGPFDSIKLPNFKKTSGAISIESSGRLSCTETKRRIDFTSKNRWVCYSNGYKFYEQEKKSELQESLAMKYSTSLFGLVDVGIALFLLMVAGVFL